MNDNKKKPDDFAKLMRGMSRVKQFPIAGTHRSRGEIRFIDGYRPGDDSLILTATNMTSLSLLQAWLNEIDAGILVKPTTW